MSAKPAALSVLGLMSGTSLDGVDLALCSIDDGKPRLRQLWRVEFAGRLRERLVAAAQGISSSHELAQLHHDLGRFYAERTRRLVGKRKIDLVGVHGQTVFHNGKKPTATLQLGEPAYLAEGLRVPVISNFRAADLAAGGQGAPLATLFHRVVFGKPGAHVCINNLGGISNVTSVDWRKGAQPRVMAFDTGPANMPIDLAMQRLTHGRQSFDRDGRYAKRGHADEKLLQNWLKDRFIQAPPPKSTGREQYGERFVNAAIEQMRRGRLNRFDMIATLTEFTARSIALNYQLHLPSGVDRVILCGGGAANTSLANQIRKHLSIREPAIDVETSDDLGWPLQSVEPAAFALLAYYRWKHRPGNIPATTGARRATLLGQITEP